MQELTYGNSAALLRSNGYAPAPLSTDGRPFGPWAVMQLKYPDGIYENEAIGVFTSVPMPRSGHDSVQVPNKVAVAVVTVRANGKAADEIDAIVARYTNGHPCPTRVTADGSSVMLFKLDDEQPFEPMNAELEPIGFVRIDSRASFVELGAPQEWRDGVDLFNTCRNDLPPLSHEQATKLFDEVSDALGRHMPIPELKPYVRKPILEAGQRLLFGNSRALYSLRENGFVPCPVVWGKQSPSAIEDPNAGVGLIGRASLASFSDPHPALTGLATIELKKINHAGVASEVKAIIERFASPASLLVRADSEGGSLYLFQWNERRVLGATELVRSVDCASGGYARISLRVAFGEPVVLSGADEAGKTYEWSGDPLAVRRDKLPELDCVKAKYLVGQIETLLQSGRFRDEPATSKRSRKTATQT